MNPVMLGRYGVRGISPPAPGDVRVTDFAHDDERSIHFELGQMSEYVLSTMSDGHFISFVRDVVTHAVGHLPDAHMQGGQRYLLMQVMAWFEWVKMNFTYIGDTLSYHCSGPT